MQVKLLPRQLPFTVTLKPKFFVMVFMMSCPSTTWSSFIFHCSSTDPGPWCYQIMWVLLSDSLSSAWDALPRPSGSGLLLFWMKLRICSSVKPSLTLSGQGQVTLLCAPRVPRSNLDYGLWILCGLQILHCDDWFFCFSFPLDCKQLK